MVRAYQHTGTAAERLAAIGTALPAPPDTILDACEAHLAYAGNNYFPFLWACYRSHRPTLFRLVRSLSFESTSQNTSFLDALAFLLQHETSKGDWLPLYREERTANRVHRVPLLELSWVPEGWWRLLTDQHTTVPPPQQINRRHFEVCVFTQLLAELKSGDIAIVGSDAFADYRMQLIDWEEYQRSVGDYGAMVAFPTAGPAFVVHVRQRLAQQAQATDTTFPTNEALRIEHGEPVLIRLRAQPDPPRLAALEAALAERLTSVNILDVIRTTWPSITFATAGTAASATITCLIPISRCLAISFHVVCGRPSTS